MHRLLVPEQQVEDDELRRNLCRELSDPRLCGVQPHLHRVEVEHAVARDHNLAVEGRVGREEVSKRPQLREVAEEGALVP
jgi:hypothetical protein